MKNHHGWRVVWKRVCCGSLGVAAVFFVAGRILAAVGHNANQTALFLVLDGLLALGELGSLTIAGIAGRGKFRGHNT